MDQKAKQAAPPSEMLWCRYQIVEPHGGCNLDLRLEGWLVVLILLILFWCAQHFTCQRQCHEQVSSACCCTISIIHSCNTLQHENGSTREVSTDICGVSMLSCASQAACVDPLLPSGVLPGYLPLRRVTKTILTSRLVATTAHCTSVRRLRHSAHVSCCPQRYQVPVYGYPGQAMPIGHVPYGNVPPYA